MHGTCAHSMHRHACALFINVFGDCECGAVAADLSAVGTDTAAAGACLARARPIAGGTRPVRPQHRTYERNSFMLVLWSNGAQPATLGLEATVRRPTTWSPGDTTLFGSLAASRTQQPGSQSQTQPKISTTRCTSRPSPASKRLHSPHALGCPHGRARQQGFQLVQAGGAALGGLQRRQPSTQLQCVAWCAAATHYRAVHGALQVKGTTRTKLKDDAVLEVFSSLPSKQYPLLSALLKVRAGRAAGHGHACMRCMHACWQARRACSQVAPLPTSSLCRWATSAGR